jgi:hypothetical protein
MARSELKWRVTRKGQSPRTERRTGPHEQITNRKSEIIRWPDRMFPYGKEKPRTYKNRSALPFIGLSFCPLWVAERLSRLRMTAHGLRTTAQGAAPTAENPPWAGMRDKK